MQDDSLVESFRSAFGSFGGNEWNFPRRAAYKNK